MNEINWYSALDASKSDIARYARSVIGPLDKRIRVNTSDGQKILPSSSQITNIYHLGNHLTNIPIVKRLFSDPGIVVLHETNLIDLARACSNEITGFDWYEQLVFYYGAEARLLERKSTSDLDASDLLSQLFPLFQPFLKNAKAVIVHSQFAKTKVQEFFDGPVEFLPLSYLPEANIERDRSPVFPIQLIFCGHVGGNRRLIPFLKAWSEISNPSLIRFNLYGHLPVDSEFFGAVDKFGLADWVEHHGFVTDEVLAGAISNADLAVNLRWPTMGESSGSLLRYWNHGITAVVTNTGSYKELDESTVFKVSKNDENTELILLLERFIIAPEILRSRGLAGRAFLLSHHAPERYIDGLLKVIKMQCNSVFIEESLYHTPLDICVDLLPNGSAELLQNAAQIITTTLGNSK